MQFLFIDSVGSFACHTYCQSISVSSYCSYTGHKHEVKRFSVKLRNAILTHICGRLLSLGRRLLVLLFYWQIWVTFPQLFFFIIFFYLHLNFADNSYRQDVNIWRQLKVRRARIVTEFARTHSVPPAVSCIIYSNGWILLPETEKVRGRREILSFKIIIICCFFRTLVWRNVSLWSQSD